MMTRIGAIALIYACTAMAWMILGNTVDQRTGAQDENLKTAVTQLWGTVQRQRAPEIYYQTQQQKKVVKTENGKAVTEFETETTTHPLLLDGSDINVSLNLEHRQKGLLWYSTYRVGFDAKYRVVNYTNEPQEIFLNFAFPTAQGIYDNFRFAIGGREEPNLQVSSGKLSSTLSIHAA